MREIIRIIATTIIWSVFLAVVGVSLTGVTGPISQMNGGEVVALMTVLMAGAVAMTYAIWHSGFQREHADDYAARLSKSKRARPDRISRLIDDLEDEEIYELEALLLDRERSERTQQR